MHGQVELSMNSISFDIRFYGLKICLKHHIRMSENSRLLKMHDN